MNAPIRKFAVVLAAAAVTAGLTACVGAFSPRTDPSSPVAARVQALVDANREYPRWADFPKAVQPQPNPAVVAAEVNTLRVSGEALADDASRIEWTLNEDPAAFGAAVQARVDAVQVAPVTQDTAAEIEEFARQTRERGRAPPPIPRR